MRKTPCASGPAGPAEPLAPHFALSSSLFTPSARPVSAPQPFLTLPWLGRRIRAWVDEADARDLLPFLFVDSEQVVATVSVRGLPDKSDVPFLETAMTAGVPLVTGNRKHFPAAACRKHPVLTPAEFLRLL